MDEHDAERIKQGHDRALTAGGLCIIVGAMLQALVDGGHPTPGPFALAGAVIAIVIGATRLWVEFDAWRRHNR